MQRLARGGPEPRELLGVERPAVGAPELVRSRRIVAREEMGFRVDRVGTADRIATIADTQPLVYGVLCVLLAALAGWFGSILFRRS